MLAKFNKRAKQAFFVGTSIVLSAPAHAVTAPTDQNSLGYKVYDVAVNEILNGPIGFVGGVAIIIISATQIAQNWKLASLGLVGGSAALAADEVATGLGALI